MNSMFLFWCGVMAVALVIEALTAALLTVWFVGGGLVAAIMAYLGCPIWSQVVGFVVVSGLLFVLLFKPLKNWLKNRTTDFEIDSGNRLKNAIGIVVEEIDIDKQTGRVKVGDVDWVAESTDGVIIEKGKTVVVEANKGNILFVKEK